MAFYMGAVACLKSCNRMSSSFKRPLMARYFAASEKPINIRQCLKGLYLKVHPDVLSGHGHRVVKKNEKSIQTLNSFLDIAVV